MCVALYVGIRRLFACNSPAVKRLAEKPFPRNLGMGDSLIEGPTIRKSANGRTTKAPDYPVEINLFALSAISRQA